ncbi:MAG: lipocalin-like domain-containing protein [Povalibacter sp.]
MSYPPVTPEHRIELPGDEGAHPEFRTEWWYVTGWLERTSGEPLGFQITFFRTRPGTQEENPSKFAARQVLFAHAALSDPRRGRLLLGERAARAGFGLAEAAEGSLDVAIDDWSLRTIGEQRYQAVASASEFGLDLSLQVRQPPLLNGKSGFSQKSPDAANASYYYSVPQLQVSGTVVVGEERVAVTGTAWLDHEWSTAFLDPRAQGWDWIGLNLDDGGALMASRIRRADGTALWSFASLRESSDAATQTFEGDAITWTPGRSWRSVRTGITYPVEWTVQVGGRNIRLVPLMDDQESDTRSSTGTIYWEGAVRALDEHNQAIGHGYLELTGYGARLKM